MRRVPGWIALAVAVLAVAGCAHHVAASGGTGDGPVYDDGSRAVEYPPIEATALDKWRDFPATAHPRPIVLLYGPELNPGYATNDAKLRAGSAGYTLPALPLPTLPATLAVTLPDGPATLPSADAVTALQWLRPTPAATPDPSLKPLPILSVSLGSGTFRTDRGDLTLPAWQFTARDGLGPILVPAVAASAFWHEGTFVPGAPSGPAHVAPNGRTLRVPVTTGLGCGGSPPALTPTVTETASAVAVGVAVSYPPQPSNCAVPAIAKLVDVTVTLKAPLGGRVLVTGAGAPIQVAA